MSVKFNGILISPKSVIRASIVPNWNNSMGEYYPYISLFMFQDGTPQYERIDIPECPYHNDPYRLEAMLQYETDNKQLFDYETYAKRLEEEREFPIVRRNKMVQVVRGRKIEHGTTGIVFWTGATKFGTSVGIELANGQRVFTSIANVKVIKS